jgi:hypothetical protein
VAVTIAAALVLLLPLGASQADPDQPEADQTGQTEQTEATKVEGKKFAAYEYGWYPIEHVDHFEKGGLPRYWHPHGPGIVRTQNGMITIYSTRQGSTGATIGRHAWDRGRWEIRMRANRYERTNRDFTATAVLVPAGKQSYNCGARNVALASFSPERHRARFYSRTLPNNAFRAVKRRMNLSNNYWHTYAVELTPRRISWFVDGKVRRTERRPAALSGIRLALRLELTAVPGARMNESRLQVDTVRYFTLKSKNKKSIRAPRTRQGTYAGAC